MSKYTPDRRPKVFISYSWTSVEFKEWVEQLATYLQEERGIIVTLDVWDLRPGNDMYLFMEESIRDADKVLIICDRQYSLKANKRQDNGVSTETQIISPEVFANTKQEKFIPVFYEKDENGEPYVPTYLKARLGIDLSSEEKCKANLETLVKHIYDHEISNKPKLGPVPDFNSKLATHPKENSKKEVTYDKQRERILWLLPRGFLIICQFEFREDPNWAVTAEYFEYSGEPKLGIYYKPERREMWRDTENCFKNLMIPKADWVLEEYYFALDFVQKLRDRKKSEVVESLIEEKRNYGHDILYYGPGETMYVPQVPEKFKVFFETGELRDIQQELQYLRDGKLWNQEKLVSRSDALRLKLRLAAQKYFGDNNPSFEHILDVLNVFKSISNNHQMELWIDRIYAVLDQALELELQKKTTP